MPSLQLSDLEQSDYRAESGRQVGITVTPKKEWCVSCETMRTASTGIRTAIGFMCHGCSNGANQSAGANPETKNPAVGGPGRPGGVL